MKSYSIDELKEIFRKYNYKWEDFNIIAVRNKADNFDQFDDEIYIATNTELFKYSCTTNAGSYYLITKWLDKRGCAVLRPGQYKDAYSLGLHRNKYPALIQVKPVTVWRDNNKNQKSGDDNLLIATELIGLNIHNTYGINYKVDRIFNWSASCIVLNNPNEWKDFLNKCKKSNKKYFTLTLIESN